MKIKIIFKDGSQMRYLTLGDYYEKDDTLIFEIADTGNKTYNKLILIHEMIEQLMCEHLGILEKDILEFDLAHLDLVDPGFDEKAPYRDEHTIADAIERLLCAHMNIPFDKYDKYILRVIEEQEKSFPQPPKPMPIKTREII